MIGSVRTDSSVLMDTRLAAVSLSCRNRVENIVVAAATGVWSWWKNNNVTKAAQDAQRVLDGIKGKGTR